MIDTSIGIGQVKGTISGNYCLVYAKGKLKNSEKNFRILDKNYYSDVIFYE